MGEKGDDLFPRFNHLSSSFARSTSAYSGKLSRFERPPTTSEPTAVLFRRLSGQQPQQLAHPLLTAGQTGEPRGELVHRASSSSLEMICETV